MATSDKTEGKKRGVGDENESSQLFERSCVIVQFEPHVIMFQTLLEIVSKSGLLRCQL